MERKSSKKPSPFRKKSQPLKGKALLPINGEEIILVPGEILFVDGEIPFSPRNPFDQTFEMLIHLIER